MKIKILIELTDSEIINAIKNSINTTSTQRIITSPGIKDFTEIPDSIYPEPNKKQDKENKPKVNGKYGLYSPKEKACAFCKRTYQPGSNNSKYCSNECQRNAKKKIEIIEGSDDKPEPVKENKSFYKQKLAEIQSKKEEEILISNLRDKPKIDWKAYDKEMRRSPKENIKF